MVPFLTEREDQVLRLMCDERCLLEKVMPDLLGITYKTFHTHREHLYQKMGVHSRFELFMKAVRLGLIECTACRGTRTGSPLDPRPPGPC